MVELGTARGDSAERGDCLSADRIETASVSKESFDAFDVPENLRSCFGLRCCSGLIATPVYRSRELTDASADDVESMQKLGITKIFDLRKQAEREAAPEPDCVTAAIEVCACPVDLQGDEERTRATFAQGIASAYGRPGERMISLYGIMAAHADAVRNIVWDIVNTGQPVLVHCANGKDRAGIVCASVQRMQGVAYEDILEDYLLTNTYNESMNRRDLRRHAGMMQPDELEVLKAMFEARTEYLETFFSLIDERYGSFNAWIA